MNYKKLIKPLSIGLAVFLAALMLTSPKSGLFNKIAHMLADKKIEITSEGSANRFLFLGIEGLRLNAFSNKILDSKSSCFYSSFIYSGFYIDSPHLSDAAKALLPLEIDSIYASNSIFAPKVINIKVKGNFGVIRAALNTSEGTVKATLKLSKEFEEDPANQSVKNTLMLKFKESEEGLVYESTI